MADEMLTADSHSASPEPEDESTPPAEGDAPATPALNRAERRAQAKGKTAPASGQGPQTPPSHGSGVRGSGHAGQVRFPRTGHK